MKSRRKVGPKRYYKDQSDLPFALLRIFLPRLSRSVGDRDQGIRKAAAYKYSAWIIECSRLLWRNEVQYNRRADCLQSPYPTVPKRLSALHIYDLFEMLKDPKARWESQATRISPYT
jgi:hypothetical protein